MHDRIARMIGAAPPMKKPAEAGFFVGACERFS
jgi:hypothetical protein